MTTPDTIMRAARTLVANGLIDHMVEKMKADEMAAIMATKPEDDEGRRRHHQRYSLLDEVKATVYNLARETK